MIFSDFISLLKTARKNKDKIVLAVELSIYAVE